LSYFSRYDQTLALQSTELKRRWLLWIPHVEPCPFTRSDLDTFELGSHQTLEFLAELNEEEKPLGINKIEALDNVYELSKIQNSEIKFMYGRHFERMGKKPND